MDGSTKFMYDMSICLSVRLKFKNSITTELIGLYSSGNVASGGFIFKSKAFLFLRSVRQYVRTSVCLSVRTSETVSFFS